MSEDRGMDRMTSERFWPQGGQLGKDGHGGRKSAKLKAMAFFLEMAQTLPRLPRRPEAEAKTSLQGMKPPE